MNLSVQGVGLEPTIATLSELCITNYATPAFRALFKDQGSKFRLRF